MCWCLSCLHWRRLCSYEVRNCNFYKMPWHKTCKTLLHHHCLLTHRTNYPHSTAFKCCTSIQVLGWPWFWKLVLYIRPAVQAVLRTSCHRWVRCASGHHCHNIWQLYTGHEGGGEPATQFTSCAQMADLCDTSELIINIVDIPGVQDYRSLKLAVFPLLQTVLIHTVGHLITFFFSLYPPAHRAR